MTDMNTPAAEVRLDANSVAGLLAECFRPDLTTAWVVCAGCGAGAAVGSLPAYGLAMGAVIRCEGCEGVVLRLSQTGGRIWLDARGARSVRIESVERVSDDGSAFGSR